MRNDKLHSSNMPSVKWYSGCKNRNNEILQDNEFENMYVWLRVDVNKASAEYREMINGVRRGYGMEEIV